MKINWIMAITFVLAYASGYGAALLMNGHRRNRSVMPSLFRFWICDCTIKAGYAFTITLGVLLGIGFGLPVMNSLLALAKKIGGQ